MSLRTVMVRKRKKRKRKKKKERKDGKRKKIMKKKRKKDEEEKKVKKTKKRKGSRKDKEYDQIYRHHHHPHVALNTIKSKNELPPHPPATACEAEDWRASGSFPSWAPEPRPTRHLRRPPPLQQWRWRWW